MARSSKTSQGGSSLSNKARLPSMKTVQPIRFQPPAWQWRWKQTHVPSAGLPEEVTADHTCNRPHRFNELATKSRMGSSDWNVAMVDTHLRKLLWVHCPGHTGVKGNDRADKLATIATLTSGLILGRSGKLRSLSHHLRAQSIAWSREAWKEKVLYRILWNDERGPSSVRRTLEPFQRKLEKRIWEMGWSAYGVFRAHRYHLQLIWTEANCFEKLKVAFQG